MAEALFHLSGEALPSDAFVVRYTAQEGLSRLFRVDCELWTADGSFDAEAAVGTAALLEVVDEAGASRFFHGVVVESEFLDADEADRFRFRMQLGSFLDALAHREGSKIFQDLTIVHVIKKVFEAAGIPEARVEWKLYEDYHPREYVVQYRESELAFVQRLLEDEGIFFFFRHAADGHVLVLADDPSVFVEEEGTDAVVLAVSHALAIGPTVPVEGFSRTRSIRTSLVHLRDYDFAKPMVPPEAIERDDEAILAPYYEYPGGFTEPAIGKRRARARLRELRRDADVCSGRSRAIGLRVGAPFEVAGAAQASVDGQYVLTELDSFGEQILGRTDENFACRNTFRGIPSGAAWAPPRSTPRPRIRGIQTAIVMAPTREEETIHCDQYGRVKVRFHWDREGPEDDRASCWLRVAQLQTGGAMILPRVGWEVAVAFLEGDPDRPIVLGRLYNGERRAPYALPGAAASGSLKSHSTPGGAGTNEIKMSDSAGGQGFGISAQKDLNITIGHDKKETIAVDETHHVTVNVKRDVGANEKLVVGANQAVTVGDQLSEKIGGGQTITVGANEIANATSNFVENVGASRTFTVGANYTCISNGVTVEATSGITRTVGAAQVVASPSAILDNVGGPLTETIGAVKLLLVKGTAAESVAAIKNQTTAAAEVHLVSGKMKTEAALVTELVGGLHYQDVAGDFTVKAPMITLLGATGSFGGGGSRLDLGGGPIVLKGSKIAIKAASVIKMGTSLKMGS
jgi:type VI secretion system secreted protein VgrG